MFSFINDINNYDSRKVGRDDFDWGFISTARVSDGAKPYETAVEHPDYNDGSMVIVEAYDTIKEAEAGHKKWAKAMTAKKIPDFLVDCCNSGVGSLAKAFGSETKFKRKKAAK